MRKVLVGLGTSGTCDKSVTASFLTCLVHHFSPNQKAATINCRIEGDMLVLYSPHNGNKLDDKQSRGAINDTELESVTLHVCPEFYVKPSVYKCIIRAEHSYQSIFFTAFTRMPTMETTAV
jgi:hypothetical protein